MTIASPSQSQRGTTLLELLIAIALFTIIAGAAFSLLNRQQTATSNLQGQVSLTLALRSTTSMLQLDLVNAGYSNFPNLTLPNWPVGVTIKNNWVAPGTSCYDAVSGTYSYMCFDELNIVSASGATPLHPTDSAGDASGSLACSSTTTSGTPTVLVPSTATTTFYTLPPAGTTAAATAAQYHQGDQLLFLNLSGTKLSTAVLAADATFTTTPSVVSFSIHQTQADGSNVVGINDPVTSPPAIAVTSAPPVIPAASAPASSPSMAWSAGDTHPLAPSSAPRTG